MLKAGDASRALRTVKLGLLLVAGVAVLAPCAFLVGFFLITPVANTQYAPGYSEQAFAAVAVGDSEERVLALLGEPLLQHTVRQDPPDRTAAERSRPPLPPASPAQANEPPAQQPLYTTYLRYTRPRRPDLSDSHLARIVVIQEGGVVQKLCEIYLD